MSEIIYQPAPISALIHTSLEMWQKDNEATQQRRDKEEMLQLRNREGCEEIWLEKFGKKAG